MASGRGRPRLDIGALGNVSFNPSSAGVTAIGNTRDAGGIRRKVQATAATAELALAALNARAAKLGVLAPSEVELETLSGLLERWLTGLLKVLVTLRVRPRTRPVWS